MMMEEGDEAFEAHRYDTALECYRKADALMAVPTTRLAIALTLRQQGRWLESKRVALSAAQMPRREKERSVLTEARQQAAELVRDLDRAIPTVRLVVIGIEPNADMLATIDGIVLREALEGTPQPLERGPHRIEVSAPYYQPFRREFELAEGDRTTVEVKLEALHKATYAETPPPPPRSSFPTLAYVGFAVAGAGMATGGVTGALSLSKASSAKSLCDRSHCPESARDDADASKTFARVSDVSFGVGLLGLGVGIASLLAAPSGGEVTSDSAYGVVVEPSADGGAAYMRARF